MDSWRQERRPAGLDMHIRTFAGPPSYLLHQQHQTAWLPRLQQFSHARVESRWARVFGPRPGCCRLLWWPSALSSLRPISRCAVVRRGRAVSPQSFHLGAGPSMTAWTPSRWDLHGRAGARCLAAAPSLDGGLPPPSRRPPSPRLHPPCPSAPLHPTCMKFPTRTHA